MMISSFVNDLQAWNYLEGNFHYGTSPGLERALWLRELHWLSGEEMLVALHDPESGGWTKWKSWHGFSTDELMHAYDVHRSILPFEAIVESDYPSYEENAEAARIVGRMLEERGFSPSYFYSGGKGIHIRVWVDVPAMWGEIDAPTQATVKSVHRSEVVFRKAFIEWLRGEFVSCFGTNVRKFDDQLVKAKHLIRCELSLHKNGCKTYLGDSYACIPEIPPICTPKTTVKPVLGGVRWSVPFGSQELFEKFLAGIVAKKKRAAIARKERPLTAFFGGELQEPVCVRRLIEVGTSGAGDGFRRALFIVANALKKRGGDVEGAIRGWVSLSGGTLREDELRYLCGRIEEYRLGCGYVHTTLRSIGLTELADNCNRNI